MQYKYVILVIIIALVGIINSAHAEEFSMKTTDDILTQLAQRQSCKAVSTCEEAVRMWCEGYRRADGDGDGIPCENVCSSKTEVDRIRSKIGC